MHRQGVAIGLVAALTVAAGMVLLALRVARKPASATLAPDHPPAVRPERRPEPLAVPLVAPALPKPPVAVAGSAPVSRTAEEVRSRLLAMRMSDAARAAVGLDPRKRDYKSRIAAFRELARRDYEGDIDALLLFLDMTLADQDLRSREFNALKNSVLDLLTRREKLPEGLGAKLLGISMDRENDETWREYAIQYLGACYEKAPADEGGGTPGSERSKVLEAYSNALEHKEGTLAGTALLGLEVLSRSHPEIDREELAAKVRSLADDDTCGEATRITALRLCGTMGRTDALETLRTVAQTGASAMLRMAALAALADLGGPPDAALVEPMLLDGDDRIALAAGRCLDRWKEQVEGP